MTTQELTAEWERYGRALLDSMSDVLEEAVEDHRPTLLETADYWLSLGLTIGLEHADDARRLLELIEAEAPARDELVADAAAFVEDALG